MMYRGLHIKSITNSKEISMTSSDDSLVLPSILLCQFFHLSVFFSFLFQGESSNNKMVGSSSKTGTLQIEEFYRGKGLFVTGATGFVGKVLVEKILRSLPCVGKVYIVIRSKKGVTAKTRLQKEIIESPIFDRLRSEIGVEAFEQRWREKFVAIAGDITMDGLGINPEERKMLIKEVNIILHCAASIDFKAPMDLSVDQNVNGALRVLELAKECENLDVMNHVSTAYTGCHKKGVVKEELHPMAKDPQSLYNELSKLSKKDIAEKTDFYLGNYPNTYTFTKCLAEHLVLKNRGTVPLCIYRPTIVGASMAEPTPGWLDVISAASAFYLSITLGLVKYACGLGGIADQIPVDIVANSILCCPVAVARQNTYKIYHMGTSHRNPVTWIQEETIIPPYLRGHIASKAVDIPDARVIKSRLFYNLHYYLKMKIPAKLFWWYSSRLGTEGQKKEAARIVRIEKTIDKLTTTFGFFVENEWVYDGTNLEGVREMMSEEEGRIFNFDVGTIDWDMYLKFWVWGIMYWILKDTYDPPDNDRQAVMFMGDGRFLSDTRFAIETIRGSAIKGLTRRDTKTLVLVSNRVQEAIKAEAARTGKPIAEVSKRAQEILTQMSGDLRMPVLRTEAWFWRKIYRNFYNQILVDETGIQKVKDISKKHPIIVIPTHRSYVDFLLISYLFFHYYIPLPQIAAGDDFLNLKLINWLFRHSGAFFMRRGFGNDDLYRSIFTEYVQKVIMNGYPLEFFIEGTRSRTGMTLSPKFGVMSIILDTFFDQTFDKNISDIYVVPVSLSYEKYVEGEAHVRELLGEQKKKMKTSKLLKEIPTKLMHSNFGKIAVQFAEPISLRNFIDDNASSFSSSSSSPVPPPPPSSSLGSPFDGPLLPEEGEGGRRVTRKQKKAERVRQGGGKEVKIEEEEVEEEGGSSSSRSVNANNMIMRTKEERASACQKLAFQITGQLTANLVVLDPAVVSSLLLCHRETGISVDVLSEEFTWVKEQIKKRRGRVDEYRDLAKRKRGVVFEEEEMRKEELEKVRRALSLMGEIVSVRNHVVEVPRFVGGGESVDAAASTPSGSTPPLVGGGASQAVLDPHCVVHLAIHRNQLMHLFIEDAIVYAAFHFLSAPSPLTPTKKEIPISLLVEEVAFLRELLEIEFVLDPLSPGAPSGPLSSPLPPNTPLYLAEAQRMVDHALHQGVLFLDTTPSPGGAVGEPRVWASTGGDPTAQRGQEFLLSLILPFLESYWFVGNGLRAWLEERICVKSVVISHVQWLMRRFYLDGAKGGREGGVGFGESANVVSIKYVLETLGKMGCVGDDGTKGGVLGEGKWREGMGVVVERLGRYFPARDGEVLRKEVLRFPLLRSRL